MSDTLERPETLLDRTDIPSEVKELLRVIPGQDQTELTELPSDEVAARADQTEPYRPAWAKLEEEVRIAGSFEFEGETFLEPLVHEEPNPLLYPMCTTGKVFNSNGRGGSGVLVGRNLLLTAGHVAPWGASNWWMQFIPAYREGTRPPFGDSYVQSYRGWNATSPSGFDYVICKLFRPLGDALGWMGTASFGNEGDYENKRFVSSGWPDSMGGRPAVELNMAVEDIDNDSPGKELEFGLRHHLGPGWSGGPLWHHTANPYVVGTLSGREKDGLDPTRLVYSAGGAMVDLVRFGQANWQP